MIFARPELLWLLLSLPVIAWLHVRARQVRVDASTSWGVLATRLIVFGALIFALARPASVVERERSMRVVVCDVSASVGGLDAVDRTVRTIVETARAADEDVRVIAFAEQARELRAAPRTDEFPAVSRDDVGRTDRSDVGAALALARTLVPSGVPAAISLVSDGRDSRGFARDEVERLVARGIALDVHPVQVSAAGPTFSRLEAPAAARVGETVPLQIRVAGVPTGAPLYARVTTGTRPGKRAAIAATGGVIEQTLIHELESAGINALRVAIEREDGTMLAERSTAVFARDPLAVRLIEARGAPTQRDALAKILGKSARVTSVEAESLTPGTDWRGTDLAVVANVPAPSFDTKALAQLGAAVEDGLGLLVCGGERSYGLGGYADTPLERILPVRFQQKEERRDPSATLVIIIDTSGSMGGTRIDLAKEVARLALKRLKPHDKAGIVEFHGAKRWAAPIQPASNGVDIQRALNRLNAGGGTVILPAIEESYYGLLNVRTRTRHVLVLTDGGVEQGPFEQVVRKLADHGMTLSTVLVGPGTHSSFLVNLAQWGRGRYYHAPDRFNLPEVIVKQPESSLLSPAIEEPTGVRVVGDSFVRRDIGFDDAPPVRGVLDVEAKATADTWLSTARGEPLLTTWRYGLGQVAAWTTELAGPWTAELAQWSGYAPLFAGLIRDGQRASGLGGVSVRSIVRGERVHVFAWREDDGDATPIDLSIGGVRRQITPAPGSGRTAAYGVWATPGSGVVPIDLVAADGTARTIGATFVPPANENGEPAAARERMTAWASWTGGRADGTATETKPAASTAVEERWALCLWIGLLAFLLSVYLRRRAPVGATAVFALAVCLGASDMAMPSLGAQDAAPAATPAGPITDDVRRLVDGAVADPSTRAEAVQRAVRSVRLQAGDLDPLIEYLRERSAAEPRVAPLLARVAAIDGKPDVVEATLQKLDAAGKLDANGAMEYARVLEVLGRDDDALRMLGRAIEMATNRGLKIVLEIRRASLWLAKKDTHAKGIAALRRLLKEAPPQSDYRFFLGFLGALHGTSDLLLAADARTVDARTQYREQLLRGTFHLKRGKTEAAKADFGAAMGTATLDRDRRYAQERLIATHRADDTLDQLADSWIKSPDRSPARIDALVALLRELKRPAEAFDLLLAGKGLENTQKKTRAFRTLQREIIGLALECGRPKEVERIYKKLITREPRRTEWWSGLALLYLLRGERDQGARVFDDAIGKNEQEGKVLLQIAAAAHELSLRPQMERAAAAAIKLGGKHELRGKLMLADRAFERGEQKDATALLKTLEKSFGEEAVALAQIAESYERFGVLDDSIRILRTLQKKSPTEDMLMRLAWLLQNKRKKKEAAAVWADLWKTTKLPARIRQAEDRMLDMASNNGKLADLAIDLEERLDEKKGTFRELALLVKLYTRANDTVSAIEVLRTYGPQVGRGELETMQNMAHVYQHCEDYRKYEETLLELQKRDPENAIDYQQQIAIGALERGRGRQAKRAIERLRKIAPGNLDADEFAAGVLGMIGLPEESVKAYTRVVTAYPNRIESYLLMGNALQQCDRTKQAHFIFLDLMENAEKDDLFTIAVDGLLNLNAGPAILRVAQRRVFERIAQRPRKAFLYQLAADLAEELRERDRHVQLISLMALVAGDRRSAVLRELMDLESARGNYPEMIGYGRSLLALGEEMPPQVFLDLGKALINVDDLPTAERVFARTRIAGDYTAMQKQIAGFYAEANFPAAAARILRQTLLARPDDPELLLRVGQLTTEAGDYAQAQRDFLRAFDAVIKRSPRTKVKRARRTGFRRNRSNSVDPYKKHGAAIVRGMLYAAAPGASELVASLRERMTTEFKAVQAEHKKLKSNLNEYPRLQRLHGAAQGAALGLGMHDEMSAIDESILVHFASAARMALRKRMTRGSPQQAVTLAKRYKQTVPTAVVSADRLTQPVDIDNLFDEHKIDVGDGIRYAELLIAAGEPGPAREIVNNLDVSEKTKLNDARSMARVAFALGERRLFARCLHRWVEKACAGNSRMIERELAKAFGLGWGSLTMSQRLALSARLVELAKEADAKRRAPIEAFLYRNAADLGRDVKVDPAIFERLIDSGPKYLGSTAKILKMAPAGSHASLFKRIMGHVSSPRRYQFLSFVTELGDVASGELGEAIATAFKDTKKDPNFRPITYGYSITRMMKAGIDPRLGRALVAHLRSEFPDAGIFTLCGAIFDVCGAEADSTAAAQRLREHLTVMVSRSKLEGHERQLVDYLCNSEHPVIKRVLDETLREPKKTPGWVALKTAILQRSAHVGRIAEQFKTLYTDRPDDRTIRTSYLGYLRSQGRVLEAARMLDKSLTGAAADNTYPYGTVAMDYRRAGRPARALEAAYKVKTRYVDNRTKQTLLQELGRHDEAERLFLRTQVSRARGGFFAFGRGTLASLNRGGLGTKSAASGGMIAGVIYSTSSSSNKGLDEIACQPWGYRVLEREWRASAVKAGNADKLAKSLAMARWTAWGEAKVIAHLKRAIASGELTVEDRGLLWMALKKRGASLENDLPGVVAAGRRALMIEGGIRSASLATWREVVGDDSSRCFRALDRYQLASKLLKQGRSFGFPPPESAGSFDRVLSHASPARRDRVLRSLLRETAGTSFNADGSTLELCIAQLQAWQRFGDEAERKRARQRVRRCINALPEYSRSQGPAVRARVLLAISGHGRPEDLAGLGAMRPSVRSLLPNPEIATDAASTATRVLAALETAFEGRSPERFRAELAGWLVEAGAKDAAAAMIEPLTASARAACTAQERLTIADVARRLDRPELAYEIEGTLFREGGLNALRIDDHLAAVEKREDRSTYQKAVRRAAELTDRPEVLARAIGLERTAGRAGATKPLLERLAEVAPDHPLVSARG